MKIAMVTDTFHPTRDGITRVLLTLASALREEGHAVRVYAATTHAHVSYADTEYFVGFPFPSYPQYPCVFFSRRFIDALVQWNPDIVHIHTPGGLGIHAFLIARQYGYPTVFTYHTDLFKQLHYLPLSNVFTPLYARVLKIILQWIVFNSSAVIVPTLHALQGIRTSVPLYDIPNPLHQVGENEQYLPPPPEKRNGEKIVLVVGRLVREKNLDAVVSLASSLPPLTRVVVIGDGPYRTTFEHQLKKFHLTSLVLCKGSVSDETLAQYYSHADLLFFPSTYDTFGLVVGEALLRGLPVIAPAESAAARAFSRFGLILYTDDTLHEKVRAILTHPFRVPVHMRMALWKEYHPRRIARLHLELYQRILDRGASRK